MSSSATNATGVEKLAEKGTIVRLFWAIPLETSIAEWVDGVIENYRRYREVKWVKRENLHFTLKFLGEVEESRLGALEDVGREIASRHAPFTLELGPPGALPDYRSPRVLYYRVSNGQEAMKELAQDLDSALEAVGFEPESRPFLTHLTLGRIRGGKFPQSGEIFQEMPSAHGMSQEVAEICLFHSRLTPEGPIYKRLKEIALASGMGLSSP